MTAKAFYYINTYGPCLSNPEDWCIASQSTIGVEITAPNRKALLKKIHRIINRIREQYPPAYDTWVEKERDGRRVKRIVLNAVLEGYVWKEHVFNIE